MDGCGMIKVFSILLLMAGSIAVAQTTHTVAESPATTGAGVINTDRETTAVLHNEAVAPQAPAFQPGGSEVPRSDATTVTLQDGLTYQVLRRGAGAQADTTSTRRIHYTLWLESGKLLESSRTNPLPKPFQFTPGAAQAVVGMEQGTNDMRVGEVRLIRMPAALAYGNKEHGNVPSNSDLVFEVELVDLVDPNTSTAQEHLEP